MPSPPPRPAPPMTQAAHAATTTTAAATVVRSDRHSPSRTPPRKSDRLASPTSILPPPTAHLQHQRHTGSKGHPTSLTSDPSSRYHHGSVSSDTTQSSTSSTSKIYAKYPYNSSSSPSRSPVSYHLSPHAEQGFMPSDTHSSRRLGDPGRTTTAPLSGSAPQSMSDSRRASTHGNSTIIRYIQEREADPVPEHAIWVLIFLSALDPFFSALCAIYSVLVSCTLLISSPFAICRPLYSVGTTTIRLLAPLFRKHLQLMHAQSVDEAHTFDFNPVTLVLVHLASPLLSIGVAVSAWIAASFWLFTLMMGNPDGTERGDDGKAAVLGVRNWWEMFLLNAVRRQRH